MHIFLTGEIQVGKSTIISKTLTIFNILPQGFRTYFGPDRWSLDSPDGKLLYLNSAADSQIYDTDKAAVRFTNDHPPCVLENKFDTYGAELIRTARKHSRLILMDECGSLEKDAVIFQREILESLDGEIPILGVVKLASKGWTDKIRNHPKVTLLEVTKENRDDLPAVLVKMISPNVLQNEQNENR